MKGFCYHNTKLTKKQTQSALQLDGHAPVKQLLTWVLMGEVFRSYETQDLPTVNTVAEGEHSASDFWLAFPYTRL